MNTPQHRNNPKEFVDFLDPADILCQTPIASRDELIMEMLKLLVPVDPEFPVLGGKTIKLNAALELRYAGNNPVVALTGVRLWGFPIPNAWLGGLKHVDLVGEFGGDQGFWSAFAAGIEHISVTDGQLTIKLKE